ncbi:uncharacterized protein [Nicotiana tomentosiformis]|uniref:uncharacterized protein n=1 Tax=Nicotiana tomentosiformis TaxID=4098 RepID=UPI000878B096|nr:uncharacterized protein LOC108947641 [Nicotiana tomentosiformis]
MDQAASQPAPAVYPASQPSWLVHSTPTDQDSSQPGPTVQASSRKHSGSHWTVEAIDSEQNIKKLKVKINEVLNLTCEERIVVDFDYLDEPFGDARGLLSGFCGILACDCTLFSIHCEKWSSLPISYFNRVFDQIIKEKNELALSQSTIDESQILPNDVVGKVLGKEHSGRVMCLGLDHVPSRVFKQVRPHFGGTSSSSTEGSCSSQCQHNHNQIMNAHNQMMNAFKAYMIMKEGTIPEQFAGFFASPSTVSPTTPSDADSGPLSSMDARRSCSDSNSSGNR